MNVQIFRMIIMPLAWDKWTDRQLVYKKPVNFCKLYEML